MTEVDDCARRAHDSTGLQILFATLPEFVTTLEKMSCRYCSDQSFVQARAAMVSSYCKRDYCTGRKRLDGTCSEKGCVDYRQSRRGLHKIIIQKAQAPVRTPLKIKKPKKRIHVKATLMTTPKRKGPERIDPSPEKAISASSSTSSGMALSPQSDVSTAASTPEAMRATLDTLDFSLVAEDTGQLRDLFRFKAPVDEEVASTPCVRNLALEVASHYSSLVHQVGEPCALAIFGAISGILQKVPPQLELRPLHTYVGACFYLGWELCGSWQYRVPVINTNASEQDVNKCAMRLLEIMATS
jgi:hypothetical protein